jgi:hypothetical protein
MACDARPEMKGAIMNTMSNESLCFTGAFLLLGVLAIYGGARWLGLLIPAAIILWLAAGARCHARRASIDARVDNRTVERYQRRIKPQR